MQGLARSGRTLADQLVIVGVRVDPEPQATIVHGNGEGAMRSVDPGRPETADALDVQGGMAGIDPDDPDDPDDVRRENAMSAAARTSGGRDSKSAQKAGLAW